MIIDRSTIWQADGDGRIRIAIGFLDGTDERRNMVKRIAHYEKNILHEFGHMLGALHEHCAPDFPFKWNRQAIYHDYENIIRNEIQRTGENLTPSQIIYRAQQRAYGDIIRPLDRGNLRCSTFDDQSIMMYKIEKRWLQPHADGSNYPERRTFEANFQLSYGDGALMRHVYGGGLRYWDFDSNGNYINVG
ncbi:hypothetical protein N7540_000014 [Penicillium herquei]|nr:hypothetical protein N7540_000014 [Penicillium herquei]